MKQCAENSNHWYSNHLPSCPWCEIKKSSGIDYFPSPIGFQVGLDDSIDSQDTFEKRKESLVHYVKIALIDGYLTEEENSYIFSVGEKLHLSKREIEAIIESEQKKLLKSSHISKTTQQTSGIPKIQVKPQEFSFQSIKLGESVYGQVEISNIGGGILSGSIKASRKYLIPSSSIIDPTKHIQTINFKFDTSGFQYGMNDTVYVVISSNGGNLQIPINFSIEIPQKAFERFELYALPSVYLLCGLVGLLLGGISVYLGFIGILGRQVNRIKSIKRKNLNSDVVLQFAIIGFFFWLFIWGFTVFESKEFGYIFSGMLFASVLRYPVIEPLFMNTYSLKNKLFPVFLIIGLISTMSILILSNETWTEFLIGVVILIIVMTFLDHFWWG